LNRATRLSRRGFPAVDPVPTIGDSPAFSPFEERARKQTDDDREDNWTTTAAAERAGKEPQVGPNRPCGEGIEG